MSSDFEECMEGAPAGDEELEVPLVSQAVPPVTEKTVSCKCKSSCSQVQNAAEFRVSFVHRIQRLPAPENIPFQPDMPGIRGRHCQRTRTTATVSETHCFLLVSLSKQSSSSTMWSSPCSRGMMVRMPIQIWILRVQLYSQLYAVQLKNQVWKKRTSASNFVYAQILGRPEGDYYFCESAKFFDRNVRWECRFKAEVHPK